MRDFFSTVVAINRVYRADFHPMIINNHINNKISHENLDAAKTFQGSRIF